MMCASFRKAHDGAKGRRGPQAPLLGFHGAIRGASGGPAHTFITVFQATSFLGYA